MDSSIQKWLESFPVDSVNSIVSKRILGIYYKIYYQLSRYRILGLRSDVFLVLVTAVIAYLSFRGGQRFLSLILLFFAALHSAASVMAYRSGYFGFQSREWQNTSSKALAPDQSIAVKATGSFFTRKYDCRLVDHPAAFMTMRSGEHVVSVNLVNRRALLIARTPDQHTGWWYSFIPPDSVLQVELGTVHHGVAAANGVRITYQVQDYEEMIVEREMLLTCPDSKDLDILSAHLAARHQNSLVSAN